MLDVLTVCFFFFSSRRRHTRCSRDWSSDVCSSDLGACNGIPRRPDLRHVLSTHAHVRASEHSSSIPSFYTCLVRNLRGRGGEHRAFALWLVQKPSFVELDVLEFRAHHAPDDDLHLLRDTENQCTEEIRERAELRRVFVRERGPCYVAGRL